jgi:DNA modification methylase
MLFQGDSIRDVLPSWEPDCVDHIICDPPYGIDMDMLNQGNDGHAYKDITRVEATHQVAENEDLFERMFPVLYRVLKPTGYCICFADIMQWQRLYDNAIKAGFKVQRWPFIWCKTSQCMNQYAQANFTKNIEIAIVCRKDKATLGRPVQTSYFACSREQTQSNPFAKPFALWEFLINSVSMQGQTILDPFAGEGSSTLACLKSFRRPLAIERDATHFPYLKENVINHFKVNYKDVTFL